MLIQSKDADTDYELIESCCWITVKSLSLFIVKNKNHVRIDIYPLNKEMEPPLDSILAEYPQQ